MPKILIVEDEKSISGFIKAILSSNGFDVIIAIHLFLLCKWFLTASGIFSPRGVVS